MSDGGKGSKQRPTDHNAYSAGMDRIFGKKQEPVKQKLPPNCGTSYCSCVECFKDCKVKS